MKAAVVFQSQAIFGASVVVDDLPVFEPKWLDTVTISTTKPGVLQLNTYLGRGPLTHPLGVSAEFFFENGDVPYPAFGVPSASPMNAGLFATKTESTLNIDDAKAVFVANMSVTNFIEVESWDAAAEGGANEALSAAITAQLAETKAVLDAVIGSYALYQFPLVWQQLFERHMHAFADLDKNRNSRSFFHQRPDNMIAFRLKASDHIRDDKRFVDPLHKQCAGIVGAKLLEPLIFLKDSLWHRDLRARYLLQFWIVEYFAEKRSEDMPPDGDTRSFVDALEALVNEELPEQLAQFKRKKGDLLRRTLAEKVAFCCDALRVHYDDATFKHAKKVRDRLSHGSAYTLQDLVDSELYIRSLCRQMLRRELESRGIFMDGEPRPFADLPILTLPSFRAGNPGMKAAAFEIL